MTLPDHGNPAELKTAFIFGGLYAVVLLGVAVARNYLGVTGLYGVAILSGLHDLDAITLSTARLVEQGQILSNVGWRLIVTASLANFVVKAGIVPVIGNYRLLVCIALPFGAAILGGIGLLVLWPYHQYRLFLTKSLRVCDAARSWAEPHTR